MNSKPDKTAIVTGASRGIGYAVANYLAKNGYRLLLIARDKEKLEYAAEQISNVSTTSKNHIIADIDVSDHAAVKTTVDNFIANAGHVDLLCNNAGYVKRGTSDLDHSEFIRMINTNLIGAFNFIQTVSPSMKHRKQGRIINIVSRSGKIARKELGGYAASKFGLIGLNESIYKELATYNIQVTAICPNLVATDMTADVDISRNEMIQIEDIVKTIDYLIQLSPAVAIKEILMECRYKLINE